jgi:hypothetical protein
MAKGETGSCPGAHGICGGAIASRECGVCMRRLNFTIVQTRIQLKHSRTCCDWHRSTTDVLCAVRRDSECKEWYCQSKPFEDQEFGCAVHC